MFQVYGVGQALFPVLPPPLPFETAPNSHQTNYEIGQLVFTPPNVPTAFYLYGGAGNWIQIADAAGPIENVLGTTNQITVTTTAGTATVSLPSAIITPGSLTASTGLVATAGGITATAGDITATSGNVIINGAAKQLRVHGGAVTDFIGTATLTSGTTGAIANTNIAATDRIFIERTTPNASTALGVFSYSISAGASFTITALNPTDASTQTNDVSTVAYFIVRQV